MFGASEASLSLIDAPQRLAPFLRLAVGQSALGSFVLACYFEPHESVLVTPSCLLSSPLASETKTLGL